MLGFISGIFFTFGNSSQKVIMGKWLEILVSIKPDSLAYVQKFY